tara:strand:- start:521 stop:1192 length:672 start_codon:yes stop_codon:yes gene_type:complete
VDIKHRWKPSRIVEVVVCDAPEAWRSAGFDVGEDDVAVIAGVRFRLAGGDGGVESCRVESDTPDALAGGTHVVNGLTWHVQALGTAPEAPSGSHDNGVVGIQKLEVCPVETWVTLTELVHRVLPPPYNAFAYRNPDGNPQHVALWRMQNMEVFEMADAMGQTVNDEMAMFFLVVADLDATIARVGAENLSEPFQMAEGRRAVIVRKRAGLSVRTFLCERSPDP